MFELFKKRDFGELFNDTFSFFKLKWKNYFGNFFKVNFLILVIFTVLAFIMSQFYIKSFVPNINNPAMHSEYLMNYYMDNIGVIATMGFGFFLILIVLSIIQMAYPIFYLQLIEKNSSYKPHSGEISTLIRQNFGRLLLFCFASFFVIGTLAMLAYLTIFILTILIIGFFLWFFVVPYFSALVYLSLFYYTNKKSGYFEALGFAFNTIHNNFWKIVGNNLILYFIIQLATGVLTMIPFILLFAIGFVSNPNGVENVTWFTYAFAVLIALSMSLSVLLNNLIIVNFGLVYYGEMEKKESVFAKSEIDQIGLDE